jgi:hypothetical protein
MGKDKKKSFTTANNLAYLDFAESVSLVHLQYLQHNI